MLFLQSKTFYFKNAIPTFGDILLLFFDLAKKELDG